MPRRKPTQDPAHRDEIIKRQARVAELRLKGHTQFQIVDILERDGFVNPETFRPYSRQAVRSDLDALKKQWQEEAQASMSEYMAKQLAELDMIKRAAWESKDPELALKALDREMKLTGTAKPERVESNITVQWTNPEFDDDDIGLGADELP